jgi:hypothetical protein
MGNCFVRLDLRAQPNSVENLRDVIIKSMQLKRSAKIKMLESDQMANIELESTNLIQMNVELYNKILEAYGEYKPNPEDKPKYRAKPKCYVKPKFTIEDVYASIGAKPDVLDYNAEPLTGHKMPWTEITIEEFDNAFNQVLSKKDMLGIPKLLLKNLPFYLKMLFVNEFNRLLSAKNELDISNISIAKCSYVYKETKNGPTDKIGSFRPIMAIPNVVNHLHRILSLRLNNYLLGNKLINTTIQKGGIGGMSYSLFEQIYKIKNVIRDANAHKKPCVIVFLDIVNAYGNLKLDALYGILRSYGVAEEFITYLKTYYDNLVYYADVNSLNSKTLQWTGGLIQGCALSSTLFVTALNTILTKINDKYRMTCGYRFSEDNPILLTAYVDDLTIIAKDAESAQVVLDELVELLGNIGLKISREKSAVMTVEQQLEPQKKSSVGTLTMTVEDPHRELSKQFTMIPNLPGNSVEISVMNPFKSANDAAAVLSGTRTTPLVKIQILEEKSDHSDAISLKKLTVTKCFKYLGEYITSDGSTADQFTELFNQVVRKIKVLDSKKISSEEKMSTFTEICVPWIQRRTLTMYNMTNQQRIKLHCMVRNYINKWSPDHVQLFADAAKIIDSSLDDVIMGIKKENLDSEILGIKYPDTNKYQRSNIGGFGYGDLAEPNII